MLQTGNSSPGEICVFAKQWDANSRHLLVDIRDENGRIDISGIPQLNATKPDGMKSYISGTISEHGYVEFLLTSQLLAVPGKVSCDVSVFAPLENDTEILHGDGAAVSFTLSEKMSQIFSVKINGTETTEYTYDFVRKTISFPTAPGEASTIIVTGRGNLILTTRTFYIMVEESNFSEGAIESRNEFTAAETFIIQIEEFVDAVKDELRHYFENFTIEASELLEYIHS